MAAANLLRLTRLERLRQTFEDEGVQLLYLKGAAFLDTLYPDLGSRRMSDVDLLVREEQRDQAEALMQRAGLRRLTTEERPVTADVFYERVYVDPDASWIWFELHTAFCQRQRFDIDYDGIWRRAVHLQAVGRPIPTLCPEDSLLYAALHQGLHSFYEDGRWSEDLRRIIERWQPDWELVVERARRWHMATNLYLSLHGAQRLGALVPERALAALRPSVPRRLLAHGLFDLADGGRPRLQRWSRSGQLLTVALTVEEPLNLVRFLGSYGLLRLRDWRALHRTPTP